MANIATAALGVFIVAKVAFGNGENPDKT